MSSIPEEILNFGTPPRTDMTYTVHRILSGRFVIFERQLLQTHLDVKEVEIISYT